MHQALAKQAPFHKGLSAESFAQEYFLQAGYKVLAKRLKTSCGEIDLIVCLKDILIFVEIKYRRHLTDAMCALRAMQKMRLRSAAECFLAQDGHDWQGVRFDYFAVSSLMETRHIQNISLEF